MKILRCLTTALFFTLILVYLKAEDFERGINVELGISRAKNRSLFYDDKSYTILSPKVAYSFNNRLSAGVTASFSLVKKDDLFIGVYNSYGIFVAYNLWIKNGFYIFIDGTASHIQQTKQGMIFDGPVREPLPKVHNATEVGFIPGVGYKIPVLGVEVKLRYGFIGYNDIRNPWETEKYKVRYLSGRFTRGDFMLDGNIRRLQFSLGYTFGW